MKAIQLASADDAEDLARAEIYGLLARLFQAAPDAELWSQLQVAVTEAPVPGAFLERSWHDLVAAARRLVMPQVAEEYADLFLGVGKPEIFLHGSWHVAGALNQKPLVELR